MSDLLSRAWLAAVVDLVLFASALWCAVYGGYFVFGAAALVPALWIWIAAAGLYYPITEGLWGRSLGKFVASLSVVDQVGRPPGLVRALIRTFVGAIEGNPLLLGGLPAAIAIAATKDHRRLGDIAADTWVVPSAALGRAIAASVFD